MTNFELWGPFTGAALKTSVPLSYRIQRRRAWTKACLAVLAVCAVIAGVLAALSDMSVPQL